MFLKLQQSLVLALLVLVVGPLAAQEFDAETVSLDTVRMNAFLAAEAETVRREAAERIDTPQKLEHERQTLHREFMFMLGLNPLPPREDLQMTHVRTVKRKGYEIDVLHYQSMPGFYVTANLYRPTTGKGPYPAVVWGPGHSPGEHGAKALRQNYAIPWVRNGYICLVIDPIQVAEVFGVHRGTQTWGKWDWFSRGYTPMGIEAWNAMRGVDYLLSRDDVDGERLTINGVSGGGHLSWMAGAADPRITVVQPVAGTADVLEHITRNLMRMHCDCAYFINTYRHDWPTLAALISPRPLLLHNSTEDPYYPIAGYTRVHDRAKEIYRQQGVEDKVGMFNVPGRHGYTQPQREKAVEWSDRWLKGIESEIHEQPFEEVPGEELGALGGMFAKHPANINDRIDKLLVPEARLRQFDDPSEWKLERARILENLRNVTFRNLPASHSPKVVARGENGAVMLETEAGIQVGMFSNIPSSEKMGAVLYVASPGDTEVEGMWKFMRAYPFPGLSASRHMVYPRGTGRESWNTVLSSRYQRGAMVLGRSLGDMRIQDILCSIESICSHHTFDGELTLTGRGDAGILAAYAALLDSRVTRLILSDPPVSHRNGPVLLNVLRYTDIPQVLAMLAPRVELVFLGQPDGAFDYTKDIYKLVGAEKKIRVMQTVAQTLNHPIRD